MSFGEYKIIRVLFSHENPKSQLSLEIKTNPENEMDVKFKLKFLYEFVLKEFDENSLILVFEIEGDSLTKSVNNNFSYLIQNMNIDRPPPPLVLNNDMLNARKLIQKDDNNDIAAARKKMLNSDKSDANEMMSSRKKSLKDNRIAENETNLMMNSKKYYLQFDQVKNKNPAPETTTITFDNNESQVNSIVNNLIQNMNKFKHNISEFNETKNDDQIVIDEKPIIDYISPVSDVVKKDDDISSITGSVNSSESISKKYKIKMDETESFDINTGKPKKINIEDKLLKLLSEDSNTLADESNQISIQKKLNYQLRLTTAMNNISPTKNIIFIVTELMKYIDNFDLKGGDKKQLIISSIKSFLVSEKVKQGTIDFIVNTVCPELIDILVSVDKRNITIQKKVSCFFPFCT